MYMHLSGLLCLSAIFVIRHVLGLPLILGLWLFSRMTDNDGAEGDESLWQLQHPVVLKHR